MSRAVLADLDFGGQAKVTGLPSPTAPSDAASKSYVDGLAGGSLTATAVEIDVGATPVTDKKVNIADASITPTTKLFVTQAGRAATGRPADENEWTRLHLVANPLTGSFDLWVRCLTGRMRGKFIIDYVKG